MIPQLEIVAVVEAFTGQLDDAAAGTLSSVARLATRLHCPWRALALGDLGEEGVADAGRYGTPSLVIAPRAADYADRPERLGELVADYLENTTAVLAVLPHNDLGATLAPLIAARREAALVPEAMDLKRDNGQGLVLSRNVLGTRVAEEQLWSGRRPLIVTLPLEMLSCVEVAPSRQATPRLETLETEPKGSIRTTEILQRVPPDPDTVDLAEASIILCAGKGCSKENFEQLREICSLLKVSMGVTRPVFDQGWCDFPRMIGQTGRTVKPQLYVSFGVSGSMHHVGGIKEAATIVAVNTDAKAPIFANADQGFIADVDALLPLMLEKARTLAGGEQ